MARSTADRAKSRQTGNDEAAPQSSAIAAGEQPAVSQEQRETENSTARREPVRTPEPRGVMSASLGDEKGSPRMRLLRSHKYKQMQIEFEKQPKEKYLAILKEAGWTDRTESEGIWTKQVGQGQWQPVADAERVFKEVANAIRTDKGLQPVLKGLSAGW